MGIYDRDYSRGPQPGLQLSAPQSATMRLVVITFAVYVAQIMFPAVVEQYGALQATWYRQPWTAYQLLTYGFLHSRESVAHILINMFVLWMFGREIEQRYGAREFVAFYLATIVAAGLIWSLSEVMFGSHKDLMGRVVFVPQVGFGRFPVPVLLGASGGIAGVVALFALNFPHRKVLLYFLIPIPMWVAALIGLYIDMQGAISRTGNVAFTAHLGGAFFGLLYYLAGWSITGKLLGNSRGGWPKRRSHLRVHAPDDEPDDGLTSQVDAILQKIQEQGQDSLTSRERRILEEASQQYKQRRQ
jgi:membrane associated rhomboid family serine protease